jgi:hypothetical protein
MCAGRSSLAPPGRVPPGAHGRGPFRLYRESCAIVARPQSAVVVVVARALASSALQVQRGVA